MLVIRLQRTGRKGHAQFRVVVQDSRRTPTSGKIVAQVGTYNPHTKEIVLDKERTQTYLNNGAQPSERVVFILKKEGVKMPAWVKDTAKKEGKLRHADKLRRNQPKEELKTEEPATEESAEASADADTPAEAVTEKAEE
jgi:small subunit ribosomal protein S16